MKQPVYPAGSHDSLQYHFFCGSKLFAMRVFRADSIEHCSAWVFDGTVINVLSSESAITQSKSDHLDLSSENMRVEANSSGGNLSIRGECSFDITFKIGNSLRWGDTLETVMHQPDLECTVQYQGRKLIGKGYSKRYSWKNPPRYWGYRFLQGFIDDNETSIWTADAVFGTNKYDYFKVLSSDGSLFEIPSDSSAHNQNSAFGYADGIRHQADFEEYGVWNKYLRSPSMDSHLCQRYGRVRYFDGRTEHNGFAITEYCFGTLG